MYCEQCGVKLSGQKRRFCCKECSNKWYNYTRRLNKSLKCEVCSTYLKGKQQKYCGRKCKQKAEYRRSVYKKEWDRQILKYRNCANNDCPNRFPVFKSNPNQMSCCKSCGATARYQGKVKKQSKTRQTKATIIKRKVEYCTPDYPGQCELYAKDFSYYNISGGCFGKHFTGDCYQAPKNNSLL